MFRLDCFCTKYPEIIDGNSQKYARKYLMRLTGLMRSVHALPSSEIIPSSRDRRSSVGRAGDALSPDTPGGLAGRIAALAGIDPANPDPQVLTPPENRFYDAGMPQPWLFRMLSGSAR